MPRVILADNHAVARQSILRMLSEDPRIVVLGEASDWSEATTLAQKRRPDVLIADVHMPLGPDMESSVKASCCGAKVLGLSFANDEEDSSLANSVGAAELLEKMNLSQELIPAILRLSEVENRVTSPPMSKATNSR